MHAMRQLIVKQLDYDLTPVAGLALVGHHLKALQAVFARLDATHPIKGGVANGDVLRSYLGLLTQGKSDSDAIENYRGDAFFKTALGIGLLPSSPTLRQRMDAKAGALFEFVPAMIETLLARKQPDYGVLPCGWSPLDADTFAMDNGQTARCNKAVCRCAICSLSHRTFIPRVLRSGLYETEDEFKTAA